MGRPRYFKQGQRERQNIIRSKFVEPVKDIFNIRATELTDYKKGVPESINTVIYAGEEIFAVADTRWRSAYYPMMEFSKKDGYLPLLRFKNDFPGIPAFVIYGIGSNIDVLAWIFDPNVELTENKRGGRVDRDDEWDVEIMKRIPRDDLKLPEEIWKEAGLI